MSNQPPKPSDHTFPKLKPDDHVYLIDGSGYIFRAYHALPPLTRKSDGLPVGAVQGFCNMLWKLLEEKRSDKKPTHLVVIFDQGSSLALVRLRVKKASRELQEIFERVETRANEESGPGTKFESPFSEITDDDIDKLFGD